MSDLDAATSAWHTERLDALTTEDGWLTLVGLAWIDPGTHRVGRVDGCTVRYDGFPADEIGVLTVEDGLVRFDATAPVEGLPEDGILDSDEGGAPTVLSIGSCSFFVIERAGRLAVRIKDREAEGRTAFTSIDRFPVSESWRLDGTFTPAADGSTLDVELVIGAAEPMGVAGTTMFTVDGRDCELTLFKSSNPQQYFVVFGDATNGSQTYGGGRFLAVEQVDAETVRLDFNRAYNPPCSFTPHATCPLPPAGNRLPFAVEAGERTPK